MTKSDSDGPWPIDVEKLRQAALEFEAVATNLSQDNASVRNWYVDWESLVEKAKAGQITATLEDLPIGINAFIWGDFLDKFPQLAGPYAIFHSILEYGESEKHKRLLERARKMVREMDEEEFGKDFERPEKSWKL